MKKTGLTTLYSILQPLMNKNQERTRQSTALGSQLKDK